jgi:uncharacterized protein
MTMSDHITDNAERQRYELAVDGQVVFATYRREGDAVQIRHVEAPPALRGTGAADRLMHGVAALARANHLTLVPLCGYARSWLRRHREYADVMA